MTSSARPILPKIHTYHCLCTQLLLATPYTLSALPRRKPPSLDHAIILPLGSSPRPAAKEDDDLDDNDNDNDDDGGGGGDDDGAADSVPVQRKQEGIAAEVKYSLLLSTTVDRKSVIVRREDGFEKRSVRRCGRCRLVVGYMLVGGEGNAVGVGKGSGNGVGKVVYLLPGGLVETGDVRREGWEMGEGDVALG